MFRIFELFLFNIIVLVVVMVHAYEGKRAKQVDFFNIQVKVNKKLTPK